LDGRERLRATIFGAASIRVYGNARDRHLQVNGAGEIKFAQ
jgi:hypothetical protein